MVFGRTAVNRHIAHSRIAYMSEYIVDRRATQKF